MKRCLSMMTIAVAAFATGIVLAHTELTATMPADRAMIANAPDNVELRFSEPVRLTALSIQRDGERKQSLGPLPSGSAQSFAVALPAAIGDGHYVVSWRALAEDTHVMSGEFMFAVGAQGSHDAHMDHDNMPATEHHALPADTQHDEHGGVH